jgi:hypothetical protein
MSQPGISKTTFIATLVIAILASSLISTVSVMQFGVIQGPRGETGPQGPTGPSVIPFASTYISHAETTSSSWVDIPGMSVNLTVNQTSNLVIMLSIEAYNAEPTAAIGVRALVGAITAIPDEVLLRSLDYSFQGFETAFVSYSCNFYKTVSAGTYLVKIQWQVTPESTGKAGTGSLIVIALPTQ